MRAKNVGESSKKDYGDFATPEWTVNFMVNLIDFQKLDNSENINILEPACGSAQFLFTIIKKQPQLSSRANFWGVEINETTIDLLRMDSAVPNIRIINADYLLWNTNQFFDLIIGNPPYGIPSNSKHYAIKVDPKIKLKYKERYETWHGKYNVYGAFIEKSIKLLKPGGQLIFIVPATFMILDDFKKLREFLSQNGKTTIIYMGPNVFKPEADVTVVILNFVKSSKAVQQLELMEYKEGKIVLVQTNSKWQGELVRFETNYTRELEKICSYRIGDIYKVSISPRTSEIRRNPFVIKDNLPDVAGYLPVLNSKNLTLNGINYENFTGYWVKQNDIVRIRKYFSSPHIVIGLGFRENSKIAAAIDYQCFPWMGDVYHLIKRSNLYNYVNGLTDEEVVEYLRSDYVKNYIKETYRGIIYHLNSTLIKHLPLPNREEWGEIKNCITL